jgi:hypothetical protein
MIWTSRVEGGLPVGRANVTGNYHGTSHIWIIFATYTVEYW